MTIKSMLAGALSVGLVLASTAAHAIDWKQQSGQSITLLFDEHPWTTALKARLPEFEALSGIKVDLQTYSEDLYLDRMQLAVRSPTPLADVYFASLDTVAFSQWSAKLMTPLTPFIDDPKLTEADYDAKDFPEGFRQSASFPPGDANAQIFGIPITFEAYILFYNKELVGQYLGGKVPGTLPEVVEAAQKISKDGGGKVFGAVARGMRNAGIFDTLSGVIFDSWGEPSPPLPYNIWFDKSWSKPSFTDPRIVEGMKLYAGLLKAAPSNALSMDWPEASQLFMQGRSAFYVDASLFGPGFEDSSKSTVAGKVGYMPLPPVRENSRSGHWLWSLAIPQNSQKKEAAWLFIQWATSKAMTAELGRATGGAPRTSAWESKDYIAAFNPDFIAAVNAAMQKTSPTAVYKEGWEEAAVSVIDAIHQIYQGADPAEAAAALEESVSGIIK